MAEDKYIKLHNGSEISDLKFNNYSVKYGNQFTSFKSIVPKVNTNTNKGAEGEWEINDDCEVEIISPRKIAIKKFKIDTWIIRRKTGSYAESQTNELYLFGHSFKIKVSGLDYVHNNVVYQEDSDGNKTYGFTKAYAKDGYNIYWYPGQFTSGNYIQGLGIQGGIGYLDNENTRDESLQMGKHPWNIGTKVCITDGFYSGIQNDGTYKAMTIGLYGGYQTATKWHDYDSTAYKIYDISEHPIIIDLDVEDVSMPIDPSSIECWDMYLGEQQIFKKNRTVENCWLKYGFAEKVSDNIYKLTNNCSSHINPPIDGRKYFTPIVSDYKKYFTNKLISYSGDLSDITNPIMCAEYYKLYDTDNMYHSNKCTSKIWVKGEKISGKEYTKIPINTTFYTKDWVASNMQRITQYVCDENGELVSSAVISIPEGALEVNSAFECNNKYYNIVTSWEEIRVTYEKPKVCGFVWQCINYNQELWDDIRNFYANEYVINNNIFLDNIFDGSNMNGEVTLKLSLTQFSTAYRILANSNVEKLNIIVTDDNTNISSTLRMFRDASNLKEITFQNLVQPSKCLCAAHMVEDMFSGTRLLKTYPSNLIDWSNRANLKSSPGGDTAFSYFIDFYSSLVTIPMCSLANGDREHDTNTIVSTRIRQSLNACTNLTYFGPTLNVIAVHPTNNDSWGCFNGCVNLADIRIKNLNHGDWRFDGSKVGSGDSQIFHGTLASLNRESIKYLFDNACDLTKTAVNSETTPNVLNTFSAWSGDVTTQYSYCHYSIGGLSYRFLDKQMSFDDDSINIDDYLDAVAGWSTNKKFYVTNSTNGQVLDKLTVKITKLNSSDFIWFGTQDRTSGTKITINDLSNGIISLSKNNTETYGFYLYTTDPTMVGQKLATVTVEIVKPCNPYMSSVHSASIYCPTSWFGIDSFVVGNVFSVRNGGSCSKNILSVSQRMETYADANSFAFKQYFTCKNMKIKVSGLVNGDALWVGNMASNFKCGCVTKDGTYTINKINSSTIDLGTEWTYSSGTNVSEWVHFGLINSTDSGNTSTVTIEFLDGTEETPSTIMGAPHRGSLVTNYMVKAMNAKGWKIYVGGVEKTYPNYEFVDLGLPSGLKWAKWNVGATKPEESGLYFAWGEDKGYVVTRGALQSGSSNDYNAVIKNADGSDTTKTFTDDFSDYKYYENGELTKYNATDGLTTLANEDDGCYLDKNDMRMPTQAECQELIDNTTSAWTQNYNGSGINGVTLRAENGNSIFIPAVGAVYSGVLSSFGLIGHFWSSSLSPSYVDSSSSVDVYNAFFFDFSSDFLDVGPDGRYLGIPIRAVRK